MAQNLPPIFKVNNRKSPVDHNTRYVYATTKEEQHQEPVKEVLEDVSIEDKINAIFNTRGYSFNIPVEIMFAGKKIETFLAARTKNSLITLDNETIPIATITSLNIKKPI